MAQFKGAVIGIGGIGKWHGQMMRDTGRIDVVAVCDVNEKMKDVAKEHFPDATFYTSADDMFAKEKLDLVAVVTPHDLHAHYAIQALNAGANVIVEKPMATRYTDCVAMMEAAKKNDCFLTVFHNRRLDPWYLSAKSVIDDGLLGKVIEVQTGIHFGPGPQTWRGYKEKSGGILFDWGAHLVDYSLNLIGSEVRAVSGFLYRRPDVGSELNEDHGTVRIFFENGAMANVTVSAIDRVNPSRFRIIGEKGTLIDEWQWGDQEKLKVHTRLSGGELAVMDVPYRKANPQKYYDNIADHMTDGAPLMVTAESAAKIINIFNTAERSSEQGGMPLSLEQVAAGV